MANKFDLDNPDSAFDIVVDASAPPKVKNMAHSWAQIAELIGPNVMMEVEDRGDDVWSFNMMILDDDFEEIGSMVRVWNGPLRTFELDIFQIEEEFQGKGIARRVHAKTLELADKWGITNYELHANIDVGGYAWLRAGMVPDRWNSLQRQLIAKGVTDLVGLTPKEAGKYIQTNLKALKPHLLGTSWVGGLDLSDKQQLKDFTKWTKGGVTGGSRVDVAQLSSQHALTVTQYANGVDKKLSTILVQMEKDILAAVAAGDFNEDSAQKIVAQINAIQTKGWSDWNAALGRDINEFSIYENDVEFDIFNSILGPEFPVKALQTSPEAILSAVYNNPLVIDNNGGMDLLEPFTRNWESRTVTNVNNIVRGGIISAQPRGEMRRAIMKATEASRQAATTISRTALNHVSTQARDTLYRENKDIVIGYEIIATLDRRTTTICRDLDGEVILFTDARQLKPPFHPGCRTTTGPKLRPEFEMFEGGMRASVSGPVDSKTTYYSWLADQPAAVQDSALGKTRGIVFRDGGLTPEEFKKLSTNDLFQPLTLVEMQEQDAAAFKRAGVVLP